LPGHSLASHHSLRRTNGLFCSRMQRCLPDSPLSPRNTS
jgi:hypothetical protein